MRSRPARTSTAAAIGLLTLVIAACQASRAEGERMAAAIRAAEDPAVKEVVFSPANFLDDPSIYVFLTPGSTERDAARVWCRAVVPAGGSHDYDPILVEIYNEDGTLGFALDTVCP